MLIRVIAFNALVLYAAGGQAAESTSPKILYITAEAQANERESDAYGRLVKASPEFRNKRMRLECGPIEDPALKEQCMISFGN